MRSLFPYEKPREVQDEFIRLAEKVLIEGRNLLVHAPTGLGKTAAALAPALSYALQNGMKVIFLTSRHTQHSLAIRTLQEIKARHVLDIRVTDLIGKKWMCAQGGVGDLYSGEFIEFCKGMKESGKCVFYENMKDGLKLSVKAKQILSQLEMMISHTEDIIRLGEEEELCPYELTLALAAKSHVIIADYFYVFHPFISETFMKKAGIDIGKSIIIVDEAHNLPQRLRTLASARISSYIVKRSIKEARKFARIEVVDWVKGLAGLLDEMSKGMLQGDERVVEKEEFLNRIRSIADPKDIIDEFESVSVKVRAEQKVSFLGVVAQFLKDWQETGKGFAKILSVNQSRDGLQVTLSNLCLDPSLVSQKIFEEAHSSILMSGTLTPTAMYKDLLSVSRADEATFKSPFPQSNRLNLIVPLTTTKFTMRSDEQYRSMALICQEITEAVPGNTIIFFPSYHLRDKVLLNFSPSGRRVIIEKPNLSKQEKADILDRFRSESNTGVVLLAVVSGSFGEGIDLPGDLLKAVIIVGLPLDKPNLETLELIRYFDEKHGKGWDYGYIFPAFNKVMQNAGRCIRSENDRGIIVFLDERYIWPNYKRCFPPDWEMKTNKDFGTEVTGFFKQ